MTTSPKPVLFITHGEPRSSGHGGNHRTYQIYHDLCRSVGADNVIVLRHAPRTLKPGIRRSVYFAALLARNAHTNVVGTLAQTNFTKMMALAGLHNTPEMTVELNNILRAHSPCACIVEAPVFHASVNLLKQRKIPVIAAFQNMESLDTISPGKRLLPFASLGMDFAREINLLSRYNYRLFISKVETALIGGLGLPSVFYPYVPVGEVYDYFLNIRQQRSQAAQTPGLFAMIGSAFHPSTYEGMRWFVDCAVKYGLPENVRVVIAGRRTETLAAAPLRTGTIEAVGKISSADLTKLLIEAQAVLIPHFRGFGGLTKLPEMSLAGIPILASTHVTHAVNPLPHLIPLDDHWENWITRMTEIAKGQFYPADVQTESDSVSELQQLLKETLN